eukprot:104063-Chlamydomonas_euryale.AAC.1
MGTCSTCNTCNHAAAEDGIDWHETDLGIDWHEDGIDWHETDLGSLSRNSQRGSHAEARAPRMAHVHPVWHTCT